MKIIVDTDILVSIYKKADSNHKKAVEIASANSENNLYISPLTIPETVTVLSCDLGQKEAKDFLQNVKKQKLTILSFNDDLWKMTDEIFLAQTKKGTSWFDCLNAALYRYYHMDAIFSFDKFYQRIGLKILK